MALAAAAFGLFANAGFHSLVVNYRDRHHLLGKVIRLRAENQNLTQQWQRLQQDPTYTDYLIRKDLGYVKKGEVEYRWRTTDKK